MSNLLANYSKAMKILHSDFDKVARNIPRRGQPASQFTSHDGLASDLERGMNAFKASLQSSGVQLGKVASFSEEEPALTGIDFEALRLGAEEAMHTCIDRGDEETLAKVAAAAAALDAADELEKYARGDDTLEKSAALGMPNSALAGAALGALAGGGIKYVLSDKAQRKRGLSRLLDAALLGAAAGGLGGWAYDKYRDNQAVADSPQIIAKFSNTLPTETKSYLADIYKHTALAEKDNEKFDKSMSAEVLGKNEMRVNKDVEPPKSWSNFWLNPHIAQGWGLGAVQSTRNNIEIQVKGMTKMLEHAEATGDETAAKALRAQINESATIAKNMEATEQNAIRQWRDPVDVMAGRNIEENKPTGMFQRMVALPTSAVAYTWDRLVNNDDADSRTAQTVYRHYKAGRSMLAKNNQLLSMFAPQPQK